MSDILIGKMNPKKQLEGSLSGDGQLQGLLNKKKNMSGSFDLFELPDNQYTGAYSATPTESTQVFPTASTTLLGNFTVNPIPSEYIVPSGTMSITENNIYDIASYANVDVSVSHGTLDLQSGSATIDAYGTSIFYPEEGYNGFSEFTTTVPSTSCEMDVAYGYSYVDGVGVKFYATPRGYYSTSGWINSGYDSGDITYWDTLSSGTTVTPTESSQTVGGTDVMMRGSVTVAGIPSNYIGTDIPRRDDDDLALVEDENDAVIVASSGYYQSNAQYLIEYAQPSTSITYASSTHTVTATYTFSSSGYMPSGAISTSESLAIGSISLSQNGTYRAEEDDWLAYDVVTVSVAGGSASLYDGSATIIEAGTEVFTPEEGYDGFSTFTTTVAQGYLYGTSTISCSPSISVSENGKITAGYYSESNIYPVNSTGWIESTQNLYTYITGNNEYQLSTQGASTITPSTASQTAVASGYFTTGSVTVAPIPSQYIVPSGTKNITANGTDDVTQYASVSVNVQPPLQAKSVTVTADGDTEITPDVGYYGLSKATATVPSTSCDIDETYGLSYIDDVGLMFYTTPRAYFSTSGWIDSGYTWGDPMLWNTLPSTTVTPTESSQTFGGSSYMMLSALTVEPIPSNYVQVSATQSASTYNPNPSIDRTIASGTYLTGSQTIKSAPLESITITAAGTWQAGEDYYGIGTAVVPSGWVNPYYTFDGFSTSNAKRYAKIIFGAYTLAEGYIPSDGTYSDAAALSAVASGTTIIPSTSSQTVGGAYWVMEDAITVSPIPSQYIVPSGTMSVSANGTYDIGSYASVNVSVSYIDGDILSYGSAPYVGSAIVGTFALCEEEE